MSNETESESNVDSSRVSEIDLSVGEPTGETFNNLTVLEDVDHPLVPEVSHNYYDPGVFSHRSNFGDEGSLLETIGFAMENDDYAVMLIGETGNGKNTAIAELCSNTYRAMVRVNFGVDVTYDELVGHYAPDPDAGEDDPQFRFVDGLLKWAVENGAVFVADEINAASGEVTMPLHGLLEEKGKRELVVRETAEVIKPHPEFKFVATMNPTGYAGTKEQNQAFKGRFIPIEVDYMKHEDEVKLLQEKEGIAESEARELVSLAEHLRGRLRSGDVLTPVSTRELLKIAAMRQIHTLRDATRLVLFGVARDTDKDIFSSAIDRFISEENAVNDDPTLGGLSPQSGR